MECNERFVKVFHAHFSENEHTWLGRSAGIGSPFGTMMSFDLEIQVSYRENYRESAEKLCISMQVYDYQGNWIARRERVKVSVSIIPLRSLPPLSLDNLSSFRALWYCWGVWCYCCLQSCWWQPNSGPLCIGLFKNLCYSFIWIFNSILLIALPNGRC